jgi:hypothetical protein
VFLEQSHLVGAMSFGEEFYFWRSYAGKEKGKVQETAREGL